MEQETRPDTLPGDTNSEEKVAWDDWLINLFKKLLQINYHQYGTKKEVLK